jgi:endonuclease/exonuclease/phosphatase (EEP) superfamily protein YafD
VQPTRGAVVRVLVTAAPWAWFVVRDASPLFELVAVSLPLLVAGAVAACLVLARRQRWFVAPAISVALLGVVAVVGPWIPHDTGHPRDGVTIAVANVLFDNRHPREVVADIVAEHADIAVVPEASLQVDQLLAATYRYHLRTPRRYGLAIGVYSRLPIAAPRFVGGLLDSSRQMRVEVDHRFVLWAVHFPKPWLRATGSYELRPPSHARKLDAFLDAFSMETMPLVVAGDTNLSDRGRGYRKLTARFDDAMRGTWGGPTARKRYLRPLLLRIDHVLIPKSWCADRAGRFDLTGSDHRGVRVRVGAC